mmetsp:Transcript_12403/g.36871  ORF Transcript_12403/g.36871 Transcript_12403/m.36871 type:complete len:254 (-) Transcript_12403:114-875(-)
MALLLSSARRLAASAALRRPASSLAKDRWPSKLAEDLSRARVSAYGTTVPLAATGRVEAVDQHRVEITPYDKSTSVDLLASLRANLDTMGRGARCYWDAQLAKLVVSVTPRAARAPPVVDAYDAEEEAALAEAEAEAFMAEAPELAAIEYWVRAGDERAPVYVEDDEEVVIPELRSTPYELRAAPKQRRRAQARSKPCKAERRAWDMEYTFSAARRAGNRSNKTMRQLNKKLCRQLDDIIEELAPPPPPVALD